MRHLFLAALTLLLCRSYAQVGVTICACQPTSYVFALDLSLNGDECNVAGTQGVSSAVCTITPLGGENVTDLVPVVVNFITILEVDQQAEIIGREYLANLSLTSGDTFSYTSVLSNPQNLTSETLPNGIQLFLRGRNAENQELTNLLAVEYDNSCSVVANVTSGQQMGWTLFSDLGAPNSAVCPLVTAAPIAPVPTTLPTSSPIDSPISPPTLAPSPPPTKIPATSSPTQATEVPSLATERPSPASDSPTSSPQMQVPSNPPQSTPQPIKITVAPQSRRPNPSPVSPKSPEPTSGTKPTCSPIGKGGAIRHFSPKVQFSMKMSHPSKSMKGSKRDSKSRKSKHSSSMKKLEESSGRRRLMVQRTPSSVPTHFPSACPEEDDDEDSRRSRHLLQQRRLSESPPRSTRVFIMSQR